MNRYYGTVGNSSCICVYRWEDIEPSHARPSLAAQLLDLRGRERMTSDILRCFVFALSSLDLLMYIWRGNVLGYMLP